MNHKTLPKSNMCKDLNLLYKELTKEMCFIWARAVTDSVTGKDWFRQYVIATNMFSAGLVLVMSKITGDVEDNGKRIEEVKKY